MGRIIFKTFSSKIHNIVYLRLKNVLILVPTLKKVWKSLKDRFNTLKKNSRRITGADSDDVEVVQNWKFFNQMDFLLVAKIPEDET
jgi:hypothetical protein